MAAHGIAPEQKNPATRHGGSMMSTTIEKSAVEPAVKLKFLSHGTLTSRDLEASRRFYTEFLGLEVIRTSPISLMIRLGGLHTYAVVEQKNKQDEMQLLYHNGLDVETQEEVDEVHRIACEQADKWGLHKISKPVLQHGTYSFYFWDADENCWEILTNPERGYTWLFEMGDQQGKGHMDKSFARPGVKTD
jgi:catechol 2,3-dioxygenase-like lactoylglutathione lyase family enzyme